MGFWTILLISLMGGLILVGGGALVFYMGSLVKSAYALKLDMQATLDDGLRRMEEETEKKSRWIKRELVEEIEKAKAALATDNAQKLAQISETLNQRLQQNEMQRAAERAETVRMLDSLRHEMPSQGMPAASAPGKGAGSRTDASAQGFIPFQVADRNRADL